MKIGTLDAKAESGRMITDIKIWWNEKEKCYEGSAKGKKEYIQIEGETIALIFADLIDATRHCDVLRAERGEKL